MAQSLQDTKERNQQVVELILGSKKFFMFSIFVVVTGFVNLIA